MPVVQFVYDTCRIHWEKAARDTKLEAKEKQEAGHALREQGGSLGYLLSRYRTGHHADDDRVSPTTVYPTRARATGVQGRVPTGRFA